MSVNTRKWSLRLLKIAVCAGALLYLSTKVTLNDYVRLADSPDREYVLVDETTDTLTIRDPDGDRTWPVPRSALARREQLPKDQRPIELGLKTIVRTADWSWARWALLVFAPVTFVIAWRLRFMLATQGIHIGYRDTLLLTFAGNFFNVAMPGTTGGDLYKAYHIAKRTDKRAEGVTIVVLDRVVGLISFLLIAAIAILAARGTDIIGAFGSWVGTLMLAMIVAGGLFFSNRFRRLVRYDKWLARLPFADKIRRIDETAFSFRHHRWQAVVCLAVTVVSHLVIVCSIYFLARSLGIHPNLGRSAEELCLAVLIATVVGYLIAAIPITYQGFGLMEAVYLKVLVDGQWANASQMLALTLSARLVQIIWSLPGVIVPWRGLERPTHATSVKTDPAPSDTL